MAHRIFSMQCRIIRCCKVLKAIFTSAFLPQAWSFTKKQGISGFLHPEGVYDDPSGTCLRMEVYSRLLYHFQFQNEFSLFTGTNDHGRMRFGLHIYGKTRVEGPRFDSINNLFLPKTVDACFEESKLAVPGIKNEQDKWNVIGHPDRVIRVDLSVLKLFAKLYDAPGTDPLEARLPALHAQTLIRVLEKFSKLQGRLGDFSNSSFTTQHWNETTAQQDGTIKRDTIFSRKPEELILSGPHFFVSNPLNKTPRNICTANGHYDVLDLIFTLPDDYLPRTNYVPDCDPAEYQRRTPKVPWDNQQPVTNFYRVVST
jgi:hypothetical protein